MSRWQASLHFTSATGSGEQISEVRLLSGLKKHWKSKYTGQPTFRSPPEIIHYQTEDIFQQFSSDIRLLLNPLFNLMEDAILKISMMPSTSPTDSSRSSSTEESQGGELNSFPLLFSPEFSQFFQQHLLNYTLFSQVWFTLCISQRFMHATVPSFCLLGTTGQIQNEILYAPIIHKVILF